MARILVVDDESMVLNLFETTLKCLGHEVLLASSGRKGVEAYRRHRPVTTILDLNLSDMNRTEVLTEIRSVDPHPPFLIWTRADAEGLEQQARQQGMTEFLVKRFSLHELGTVLNRVLKQEDRIVPAVSPS